MFDTVKPSETEKMPELPPLGTQSVIVAYNTLKATTEMPFGSPIIEVWEGHQIEFTQTGGLNIYRYIVVEGQGVLQKLVVGYATGEWKRVQQQVDVVEPSRLVH